MSTISDYRAMWERVAAERDAAVASRRDVELSLHLHGEALTAVCRALGLQWDASRDDIEATILRQRDLLESTTAYLRRLSSTPGDLAELRAVIVDLLAAVDRHLDDLPQTIARR